jgi:molybdopterin-guanine dinucleotide biosynthesis protein A
MGDACTLLILAGGLSRRMGRDKANLLAGSNSLVEHLADRLSAGVDETLVSVGSSSPRASSSLRYVTDIYPGLGPLAGMHAGMLVAKNPLIWVVGCDLPDVEPALGALLIQLAAGFDAVVPKPAGELEGVCAIYSRDLAPAIESLLQNGARSIRALLDEIKVRYVGPDELYAVDPGLRSFRNLNTPADYESWLRSR